MKFQNPETALQSAMKLGHETGDPEPELKQLARDLGRGLTPAEEAEVRKYYATLKERVS